MRSRLLLGPYSKTRTLQGPMMVLGGGCFLMNEVPLYMVAVYLYPKDEIYWTHAQGYLALEKQRPPRTLP